jgi:hypothetical protein
MNNAQTVLDLDYDSPLEQVFGFLGSPLCMLASTLGVWFFMVSPGKNGNPPIWADFPIIPFTLIMACIWAVGFWLKANYDVRYQLDSTTQQLNLVRKIFGQTFKSRIADFSQLHSAAVMSTWSDDKSGRNWSYALCLVTESAGIVRVSSWERRPQESEAARVAQNLGIPNFRCQPEGGTLKAKRNRDGEVTLSYKPATKNLSTPVVVLVVVVSLLVLLGICTAALYS